MAGTGGSTPWSPDRKKGGGQIIKEQVLVGIATVRPDRIVLPAQRSFACFSGVLPGFRQKLPAWLPVQSRFSPLNANFGRHLGVKREWLAFSARLLSGVRMGSSR